MSASTYFPCDFKTVNYCLIYHTFLALALWARCVRIMDKKILTLQRSKVLFILIFGLPTLSLLYDSERGGDEPDAMVGDGQHVSERVKSLARGLQQDIARIITFSNEDLHVFLSRLLVYLN